MPKNSEFEEKALFLIDYIEGEGYSLSDLIAVKNGFDKLKNGDFKDINSGDIFRGCSFGILKIKKGGK